ncbi:MAG: hypothetical protein ACTHOK_08810 [Nocardioidaceae bacterium]
MHPRAARVVAALSALFWLGPFFGLVDLAVIVQQDPGWAPVYLLELGWGLLYVALVGVPLAVGAARGVSGVLVAQLLGVALAVAVAALWSGYPRQLLPAAGLALDAGLLAWLAGVRARGAPLDAWLRVVVVAGAVGAGTFAAATVAAFPTLDGSEVTWGLDHEPMQAGLGLSLVTVGAVATAAVGGGVPGWRVPAWTLGVTAAALGAGSVAYPDLVGSLGRGLGLAALAWAVVLVGVAELRARARAAVAR